MNCHYRSFGSVQSHVNIWLFTVKSCPCMYLNKKNPKNSLQSFDRHRWMFTTDLCFRPKTHENVIVHCKKLFLYVFERKNNPQNVASESFDRHRWFFTTDLWLSQKSHGNLIVYCQKLFVYVFERKNNHKNMASELFDLKDKQSHLTDMDEFSLQSKVMWKYNCSLSKAVPVCIWKKKFLKQGSRVIWQTDEFSLQIYVSVQSHVKMWFQYLNYCRV